MLTLEFLGAAGTVTGSRHLLHANGRRVLVDCGLFQGLKELRLRNWQPLPVAPASIHSVVLTHAHIDHSGYLPRLLRDGFEGGVTATPATADLLRILLPDSGHLQEEEARFRNEHGRTRHQPALPLYTAVEGVRAAERVRGHAYAAETPLGDGVRLSFARAGHILGASSVRITTGAGAGRRVLVFSGDLGRYGAPLLPDPAPIGDADYIVVESTYGNRLHEFEPVADQLAAVLEAAVARGGAVVVPAFAIGRTQELLYHLAALEDAGRLPRLPTYVDSPMAVDALKVYLAHPEEIEVAPEDARLSRFPSKQVRLARTVAESKAINDVTGPVLIISANGMATGGRVLHHLRRRLPDPRTTVLLVGYQAVGTRGRTLQEGAPSILIFGDEVPVRAQVATIHGLSAHADGAGLLRWLRTATRRPRRVFVVHGDPAPAAALTDRISSELGWDVVVPQHRDRVPLD